MRLALGLVVWLFLSGCTTHIHVVNHGYSQQQLNQLSNELIKQGYRVDFSSIAVPNAFSDTVIAVNPQDNQNETIANISNILALQNFAPPSILRFGQGKHFYTSNHLGLYLRHPDSKLSHQMPPFLISKSCNTTLQFNHNGNFVLESEKKYEDNYVLEQLTGVWQFNGSQLILTMAGKAVAKFTKVSEQRDTYRGSRPADVFKPILATIDNLNCDYIIIYMD